ncbi:Na+/H+ antiporter NhaC family protein [Aeromicrobium ponti]|uniref:Putative methionine transporter, NhaC family (TC 2.A.35.1.-) n=1 Tax=Cytobacillus oceanisediminis TaxID=665099 RepID=A0A562JCH5_9BACI|nr:Na+/H+ antiporter NhaC family protein [Cytobacillus oceanisediminis]TWH80840.1 putative methionine transporter, NhaC family (TC 2.A.35.1.-) [Cytobacillus oceanisediminis]
MKTNEKGNPSALLPLLAFLLIFIGSGLATGDFNKVPIVVAVAITAGIALSMNRKTPFMEKVDIFTKGAGNPNIILMAIIFLLAGAFSGTAKGMGAVDSTVNLALSFVPHNLLMVGLFIIACFISLSMGTSTGTVVALAPIGVALAAETDISVALAMAAVIGGAMFGDNLSFISDTTIAAVRTQGTKMTDKFRVNFLIVLPAAIATAIILGFLTAGQESAVASQDYSLLKVVPYLGVLAAALLGMNVILVLSGGVLLAGLIGIADGSYTLVSFLQMIAEGMAGMQTLAIIAILIGGVVEIIRYNGGIEFLLHLVTSKINSRRGAEFGIASLVSLTNVSTANNTISIIIAGPLAKNIADQYDIDPRKSASILDVFACFVQGMIPYGGQMLAASGLAAISPVSIMSYSIYPLLIGISGIIAILINFPKLKERERVTNSKVEEYTPRS